MKFGLQLCIRRDHFTQFSIQTRSLRSTAELERQKDIIQENISGFYEVWHALMEIRDRGYYRDMLGFETFEAYCRKRWDFSRIRAYQLIESVEIRDNLLTGVNIPITEFQIRPLVKSKIPLSREAWQKAVSTAPDGKVTAAEIV